jgi:hypothetical protein
VLLHSQGTQYYVSNVYVCNVISKPLKGVGAPGYRWRVRVSLGERIRSERSVAGLTLRELGDRSGISVSYLNDIEHDRTVPTLGRLVSIAQALDTDVRALLSGVDPYDSGG